MVKTVPGALATHKAKSVTSLAVAWAITRTDNQVFRLTAGSRDVDLDIGDGEGEQTYSAGEGFSRSNLAGDSELSVKNMEILGVFNDAVLDETDLRRGLFDFAEVKILIYNMKSPTDGILKMLRGQFGEAVVTPQGFFTVELRSLEQVFTQELEERYSKDCRADLGNLRCRVPIQPDELPASTVLVVGDFYRIETTPDPTGCSQIIMNFEGVDGATSGVGFDNTGTDGTQPTVGGTAQIDTAQSPAGGTSTSSLLLDGNSDFVSWTDRAAWTLGSNPVTLSGYIRRAGTSGTQTIASHYNFTGNQRSYRFEINPSGFLVFQVYRPGGVTVDVTLVSTATLTTGVDYHVAVVRKTDGDWILFIGGGLEDGPNTPVGDPHNSTANFRIGTTHNGVNFFNGWVDSFELLIGIARWEAPFTPPTGNIVVPTTTLIQEDFGNRIYQVTVAGTTLACAQTPDTVVDNTHTQGTATLQAKEAWNRHAEITAVDGTEPRRKFTVTEYTPNTAHAATDAVLTTVGFPDDHLNFGGCTFDTGANAGRSMEIRDFVADDGATITQDIELFSDLPFDVAIGDKLAAFPGCDKRLTICTSKFDNAINHVAEAFTSTADVMGQYPDAR